MPRRLNCCSQMICPPCFTTWLIEKKNDPTCPVCRCCNPKIDLMYACAIYYLKERSQEIYEVGENLLSAFRNRLGNLILRPPEDYFLTTENDNGGIMPTEMWEHERLSQEGGPSVLKCVICDDLCEFDDNYLILLCGSFSLNEYFLDDEQNRRLDSQSRFDKIKDDELAFHRDTLIHVGCLRDYIATMALKEYPIPCPIGVGNHKHPMLVNHPEKLLQEVISIRSKRFKQLQPLRKFIFDVFQNFVERKIMRMCSSHLSVLKEQKYQMALKQNRNKLAYGLNIEVKQEKKILLCGDMRQFIHPKHLEHIGNYFIEQINCI